MFDFSYNDFKKQFNQKKWSFFFRGVGGHPHFGPLKCGVSKNEHPAVPITSLFYCIILFYSKNWDVCKKKPVQYNNVWPRSDVRKDNISRFSKKNCFKKMYISEFSRFFRFPPTYKAIYGSTLILGDITRNQSPILERVRSRPIEG